MSDALGMVMQRLNVADERDFAMLRDDAARMLVEGWTVNEVVSLLRCTEEVNPDLAEDVALRRMSQIRSAVLERLEAEKRKS